MSQKNPSKHPVLTRKSGKSSGKKAQDEYMKRIGAKKFK